MHILDPFVQLEHGHVDEQREVQQCAYEIVTASALQIQTDDGDRVDGAHRRARRERGQRRRVAIVAEVERVQVFCAMDSVEEDCATVGIFPAQLPCGIVRLADVPEARPRPADQTFEQILHVEHERKAEDGICEEDLAVIRRQ